MTEISVIIACRNGADFLPETLGGLTAQGTARTWEILLADNGSTDGSRAVFERHAAAHPDIPMRVVDASGRTGKSYALNLGIRAAHGAHLLFCDADDVPAPGWLEAMAAALDCHPLVAARFDCDRLNEGWIRRYRANTQGRELSRLPFGPRCRHAAGATLGVRRDVVARVGDFDPDFPNLQDTDFCIRAHMEGIDVRFVPAAVINYRFRDDLGAIYRQAYNYARYRALLRQRYEGGSWLHVGGWRRLAAAFLRISRWRLSWLLHRRRPDQLEQARFNHRLGCVMGDLSGAVAFRVAPP